jgi:hypothetical protein
MVSDGITQAERIKNLEDMVERLFQEITLLGNEITLIKNEGCWLSKNNAAHLHGDTKSE